jgi:hypothetical protein
MYLMRVDGEVASSKRMEYPTYTTQQQQQQQQQP